METYISISQLNDFVFCPYSIYLHNVYKGGVEDTYHASPQTAGKNAHNAVDAQRIRKKVSGIEVFSQELGLMGKIDVYDPEKEELTERKRCVKQIYQGQIFQLQAQYFSMKEMGYAIKKIQFYSIQDQKYYPQPLPQKEDKALLKETIKKIQSLKCLVSITVNPNKCRYCIYNNLCDKATIENAY